MSLRVTCLRIPARTSSIRKPMLRVPMTERDCGSNSGAEATWYSCPPWLRGSAPTFLARAFRMKGRDEISPLGASGASVRARTFPSRSVTVNRSERMFS